MLKDLIKSRQKDGYIIPILEQQFLIEGHRDSLKRKRGVFHPSEISGDRFCPREWLLCERDHSLYGRRKVTANLQMRFDVGHSLHNMVQKKLGNAGVLFGKWHCLRNCLEEKCTAFGFKPKECLSVKERKVRPIWVFDELRVRDDEFLIEGSTDGLLVVKGCKYVFEFKTIYEDGFSTLIEPLERHKEQGLWYLDILERGNRQLEQVLMEALYSGANVQEQLDVVRMPFSGVVFLYMNKNSQQLREFCVRGAQPREREFLVRGDDSTRGLIDEKKKVLLSTLEHREKGTLPPKLECCVNKQSYRARLCLARNECFEEE